MFRVLILVNFFVDHYNFCLKMKTSNISKHRHGRLILMLFSDSLSKNKLKNIVIVYSYSIFFQFSIEMQQIILPVQQNLDVMEKNACQIWIQRPKNIEKIIILINCVFWCFFLQCSVIDRGIITIVG